MEEKNGIFFSENNEGYKRKNKMKNVRLQSSNYVFLNCERQ